MLNVFLFFVLAFGVITYSSNIINFLVNYHIYCIYIILILGTLYMNYIFYLKYQYVYITTYIYIYWFLCINIFIFNTFYIYSNYNFIYFFLII